MIEAQSIPTHGMPGARDGLEEQRVLLGRIARELDDYFSLRILRITE